MSYFAKIENGIVVEVVSAEQQFINTLPDSEKWLQTSYNTRGGVHYGQDGQPDGGIALRMNFAGIGYSYNSDLDAFIPPKPYSDWVFDEQTCLWIPPIPKPTDGNYYWDQTSQTWLPIE